MIHFSEYQGHFDGDPIVPGAAVVRAVEVACGRSLAGLDRVRFLGIVRPGEPVEVRTTVDGERLVFTVVRGGEVVVRGSGRLHPVGLR